MMVEDHRLYRYALQQVIAKDPGLQLVGEAEDGAQAEAIFEQCRPDVVLMDLVLPVQDGITTIRHLVQRSPRARIVVLTASDEDANLFETIQAGACGYLTKDISPEALLHALHGLERGELPMPRKLAARMLAFFQHRAPGPADARRESLTEREREILDRIREGQTNRQIGEELSLALGTVNKHVENILRKLQARNRTEAAQIASL